MQSLASCLITLGRALSGETDPSNWEKVIQDFNKFPAKISGMEDKLFHRLKLSYDRLPNNAIKSCFLYCSMFPEDWQVYNHQLTDRWIAEGFLGEVHDMHEARHRVQKIVKALNHACLLQSCGSRGKRVKMHDVIRDMALWLCGECGAAKNKILVFNRVVNLDKDLETSELKETEKIAFWRLDVEKFPKTLVCPNLKTLFVRRCNKLRHFSSGFLQYMSSLRVLDLSGNSNLSEVPAGIGSLVALRYLNLSTTRIRELPTELKYLKNLIILILNGMKFLEDIPRGVISSLVSLKLFNMYNSKVYKSGVEETLLEELESLNALSEIQISISNAVSLKKLKSSERLLGCLSDLVILRWGDVISFELSSLLLERVRNLQGLSIRECDQLRHVRIYAEGEGTHMEIAPRKKYFQGLRDVIIKDCSKLLELTWLIYVPFLESLNIEGCKSLREVLQEDSRVYETEQSLDIFSRLKYLKLSKLPKLETIYQYPLTFPSLESMKVYKCESLRSLPFGSNTSTKNLREIEGETSWWNRLRWDEDRVKRSFTRFFQKA